VKDGKDKMNTTANISATEVKQLRDETGAGMMECKKALIEANGDNEKAREILRARGVAVANKKASRATSEGKVVSAIAEDRTAGVIVEINCETDFAARNQEFADLANDVAVVALRGQVNDVDALLAQKMGNHTVKDEITAKVAKTGENIGVRRLTSYELDGPGIIASYVHAIGSKIGCLIEIRANKDLSDEKQASAVARDVAMHITSAKPRYISRQDIPATVIDNERRIEKERDDLKGKPENIRDKIVEGRVVKLMAERCLLDQPFIKDPSKTVKQYLDESGKALGVELTPARFCLYILGEEIGDSN
jgi:elongation factor Ts